MCVICLCVCVFMSVLVCGFCYYFVFCVCTFYVCVFVCVFHVFEFVCACDFCVSECVFVNIVYKSNILYSFIF